MAAILFQCVNLYGAAQIWTAPVINLKQNKNICKLLRQWNIKCVFSNDSYSLQWCHNENDCVSNPRRIDCLLMHLIRRRRRLPWDPPDIRPVTRKTSIWWPHHANIYELQSPLCLPCAGVSIQHLKVMTDCIDRVCSQFKTPLASWFKDDGRIPFGGICHQRYIKLPCIRLKCLVLLSHRYSAKIIMRFPCNI